VRQVGHLPRITEEVWFESKLGNEVIKDN